MKLFNLRGFQIPSITLDVSLKDELTWSCVCVVRTSATVRWCGLLSALCRWSWPSPDAPVSRCVRRSSSSVNPPSSSTSTRTETWPGGTYTQKSPVLTVNDSRYCSLWAAVLLCGHQRVLLTWLKLSIIIQLEGVRVCVSISSPCACPSGSVWTARRWSRAPTRWSRPTATPATTASSSLTCCCSAAPAPTSRCGASAPVATTWRARWRCARTVYSTQRRARRDGAGGRGWGEDTHLDESESEKSEQLKNICMCV